MQKTIDGKWFRFIAIIMTMSISEVAIATSDCIVFPRESANPAVKACEAETVYVFRIGEQKYVFEKDIFRHRIRQAAAEWLFSKDLLSLLEETTAIEVWLSVPESNPLAAQARAVFKTTLGNISFSFDVKSDDWSFRDESAAVLNDKTYPESFGYRPSKIFAKTFDGIPTSVVTDSLTDAGAVAIKDEGNGHYSATCRTFNEMAVVQEASKSHSDILKYVQVNSVYEWIADRQMAFRFSLDEN